MPNPEKRLVVFVHGWSVTSTDTYGGFPDRLEAEARKPGGPALDVRQIWLGRYVSFDDPVRVEDLSRAFEAALRENLGTELDAGRRFACITHSTGGPVVRDWWNRLYVERGRGGDVPMSHLIMLAPANFGSALAQLGKSRLSRVKTWFQGVEPGQGVLDWLELGSSEGFELGRRWIVDGGQVPLPPWPFVLTGQSIDRKLYDHVNSYTGESGSDGVVRVAAANLNATYVRLEQGDVQESAEGRFAPLELAEVHRAPPTALAVLRGRSHSGDDMGILRSVADDDERHPSVDAVLECLTVDDADGYRRAVERFAKQTEKVQRRERTERQGRVFKRTLIHDRYSMLVIRVRDEAGHALDDFDLLLTGRNDDPDQLPPGFLIDRQRNGRQRGTLTFFLNHDLMVGSEPVLYRGDEVRAATKSAQRLGLEIRPRPGEGFVHYVRATLAAKPATLAEFVRPNETTLLDVRLKRCVHAGTFELTRDRRPRSFKDQEPGPRI